MEGECSTMDAMFFFLFQQALYRDACPISDVHDSVSGTDIYTLGILRSSQDASSMTFDPPSHSFKQSNPNIRKAHFACEGQEPWNRPTALRSFNSLTWLWSKLAWNKWTLSYRPACSPEEKDKEKLAASLKPVWTRFMNKIYGLL